METLYQLFKLGQIIVVDLVLAGDNAIIIGMVAAKFAPEYRRKVILYGVGVAVLLRVVFAVLTVQLLAIKGLLLVGGILLLWICWKLWLDLREASRARKKQRVAEADSAGADSGDGDGDAHAGNPPIVSSIMQIVVADLSMSLDNVLAVAGIADGHTGLLVIGLAISVAFMTFSAALIANLLQKHGWIAYLGLAIIFYVAVRMMIDGALQVV